MKIDSSTCALFDISETVDLVLGGDAGYETVRQRSCRWVDVRDWGFVPWEGGRWLML